MNIEQLIKYREEIIKYRDFNRLQLVRHNYDGIYEKEENLYRMYHSDGPGNIYYGHCPLFWMRLNNF